jgi:cobalamin biosynthesis Mg chelatase CobN
MAKRRRSKKKKKSSTPNLPQEVLEKAKEAVADEIEDEQPVEEDAPIAEAVAATAAGTAASVPESAEAARKEAARRAERAARRAARRQQQATGEKPKRDELKSGIVAEMLANPTTEVPVEELKVQYNYVIADLRTMGILAAILLVVLIGLGFLL